MKLQVRIPLILAGIAAIGCFLIVLAARQVALHHVAEGIDVQHLRYQLRALLILFTVGGSVAGWFVGIYLMHPFERLRTELIEGSISRVPVDHSAAGSADVHALRHAALHHEMNLVRKTAEHARESADLKQLLNAVSEGLMQIDSGARVMQANPAALRLLGLPDNIIGRSLVSLVSHTELRGLLVNAAGGENLSGAEVTLDDRRLLLSATPIPVHNENIPPSTVIAIADLTQLRQLEGVRREFVANVSHELKTPLTSIHGYAETLLADDSLPVETRRPFLETIHRNAVRLQRIVDDLLDLSRIESGAWHPELVAIDVRDVVDDVWIGTREAARARGVTLLRLEDPLIVTADPHALRQVLSNLFDNALRYTSDGGRIEVSAQESRIDANGNVLGGIAVTDTGIGIPREALPRIFERFYRADPARSRAEGGTGLGLSIVKHTVDSMHGSVSADSKLGKGTTITVWLPRA